MEALSSHLQVTRCDLQGHVIKHESENCALCLGGGGDGFFSKLIKEKNITTTFEIFQDCSLSFFYYYCFYFVKNCNGNAAID